MQTSTQQPDELGQLARGNELNHHHTDPQEAALTAPPVTPAGVIAWLREHYKLGKHGYSKKAAVYAHYQAVCARNGADATISATFFGKLVKRAWPEIKTIRKGPRGKVEQCYDRLKHIDPAKASRARWLERMNLYVAALQASSSSSTAAAATTKRGAGEPGGVYYLLSQGGSSSSSPSSASSPLPLLDNAGLASLLPYFDAATTTTTPRSSSSSLSSSPVPSSPSSATHEKEKEEKKKKKKRAASPVGLLHHHHPQWHGQQLSHYHQHPHPAHHHHHHHHQHEPHHAYETATGFLLPGSMSTSTSSSPSSFSSSPATSSATVVHPNAIVAEETAQYYYGCPAFVPAHNPVGPSANHQPHDALGHSRGTPEELLRGDTLHHHHQQQQQDEEDAGDDHAARGGHPSGALPMAYPPVPSSHQHQHPYSAPYSVYHSGHHHHQNHAAPPAGGASYSVALPHAYHYYY